MKKALLIALCFIFAGFLMVNGTFAGDFGEAVSNVFADLSELWNNVFGSPEAGGTAVDVALLSDNAPPSLLPGGTASRSFKVKNSGSGDVYFRLVYAIQYDEESWPKLDIDFSTNSEFFTEEHSSTDSLNENGYDAEGWKDITIGNTPYKMKVFTYTEALPNGTTSPKVTISIAMDTTVTSEQVSRYRSDFLQTQVLAIETTSFNNNGYATAVDALNAALPLNKLNPF